MGLLLAAVITTIVVIRSGSPAIDTFEGLEEMLDGAAIGSDARLFREERSGVENPIAGDGPEVSRVYFTSDAPPMSCAGLHEILAPLGDVVARTSKADGSIPPGVSYECVITGVLRESAEGGFAGTVFGPSGYRDVLLHSQENTALARSIDESVGSVIMIQVHHDG